MNLSLKTRKVIWLFCITLQVKIKVNLSIFWDKIWIEIKFSLENRPDNMRSHDSAFTNLIAEFNATYTTWLVHDIKNNEAMQIESISSLYGFSLLILKKTSTYPPNLITLHWPHSYISTSLVKDIRVKPSLYRDCHYWIIYRKLNCKLCVS